VQTALFCRSPERSRGGSRTVGQFLSNTFALARVGRTFLSDAFALAGCSLHSSAEAPSEAEGAAERCHHPTSVIPSEDNHSRANDCRSRGPLCLPALSRDRAWKNDRAWQNARSWKSGRSWPRSRPRQSGFREAGPLFWFSLTGTPPVRLPRLSRCSKGGIYGYVGDGSRPWSGQSATMLRRPLS
jgi:hypothetical protein